MAGLVLLFVLVFESPRGSFSVGIALSARVEGEMAAVAAPDDGRR